MKTRKSILTYLGLIIGVLVLLNILSNRFFFRLDFTEDKRYTLSEATKNIVKSLKEPVTITAYFSDDLPQNIAQTKSDFKNLLIEYSSLAKGNLVYEFINPNENEETEQQAMKAGIQPVIVSSREKDKSVQKKAYLGAVVQMGEQVDKIPFMQPGSGMEYALSTSIKKISIKEKPVIGYLQGHGEPSLSSLQQVNSSLSVLYNVEPVTLNDTGAALNKYTTVAIVAPTDSFPFLHLRQLDDFLAKGNKLFIACGRVKGDLSNATGSVVNTGLEGWLSGKGVTIAPSFIVDANCASVQVRQQQGQFSYATQVAFPFLPIISTFEEHSITKGLEALVLPFASPITYSGDSSVKFIPIVKTSKKSGTVPAPTYFDISKQWQNSDFPVAGLTVGAVLTGRLSGNMMSKMVVIANGSFCVNGEGQQAMQLQPDNVNLMVNSIDWLSDDTGLIDLRTKGVSYRPLDQVEDGTKTTLKWINFMLPILLIIFYGFFRMQYKRNLKIKRMEENYV